jgi:hypothetical protein
VDEEKIVEKRCGTSMFWPEFELEVVASDWFNNHRGPVKAGNLLNV